MMESENRRLSIPSTHPTPITKSADYSQVLTRSQTRIDIQCQLVQLKEKAHQSFLQVIQMQQLHQEEIQQIRQDYQDKQKTNLHLIQELQKKVSSLESQLQNNRNYMIDLSNSSFTLENIDIIPFKDQNDHSRITDSSFLQIKEILANPSDLVANLRREVIRQLKDKNDKQNNVLNVLQNIFKVMTDLVTRATKLEDKEEKSKQSFASLETQYKSLKIQYQSSQKQIKFLSDHIKRVLSDKTQLERKMAEVEKSKKALQEIIKNFKKTITENGCQARQKSQKDHTCNYIDLNISNSLLMKVEDLNISRGSQISIKNMNNIVVNNNFNKNKLGASHELNKGLRPSSIQNFKKNKET